VVKTYESVDEQRCRPDKAGTSIPIVEASSPPVYRYVAVFNNTFVMLLEGVGRVEMAQVTSDDRIGGFGQGFLEV
jgi:hypothetical protein